jgi:fibronectin-binding autotransporter adhesin
MAIGRISGPLLKEDLLRDEVNLAFETNLLYLDVNTHAADVASNPLDSTLWTGNIGIRNTNPAYPLDVTGTLRATNLRGGLLDIDNVNINGNTITTSVGGLILDTATNSDNVTINSDVLINGNLHATGNITADGSLTLGDANTDNVVFAADINSDVSPNITDTYNLGGTSKRWNKAHLAIAEIGDVYVSSSTVTSSLTNGNLNLNSNGSGFVVINGSLTISSNGTVSLPRDITVGGNLTVVGDIIGGPLRTDDIQIVGNRIETTSSNSNFEINTVGTGSIELLANSNVTGSFSVSELSTLAQAQITDLTSGRVTFAGTSGRLQDSGALTFANGTLTVGTSVVVSGSAGDITMTGGNITGVNNISTGSLTTSGNTNITGTLTVTGDIVGGPLRTDDIQIVGNRIETTSSNSNFEINTTGTGSIELLANTNVIGTFGVSGLSTLAQAQVSDLTSGRVTYASTSGRLIDSANFTFNGFTLTVTGNETVTGTATLGNLIVNGTTTLSGPITASDNLTVGGTLYVTGDIVGGPLRTDDIQIVGNRIETTATNSNFEVNTTGTGSIELLANTNITGNLGVSGNVDVTGNITLGGNIRIGDTTLDTINVVADFTSDLVPDAGNSFDLGTDTKPWRVVHAAEFNNGVIRIDDNIITTTVSNADLDLRANGTGNIVLANHVTVEGVTSTGATGTGQFVFDTSPTISGATLTNHVTVEGVTSTGATGTGNIVFSASPTVTGTLTVTGDQTVTGTISTNNLTVNDNATISGTLYVTGDIVGGPLRTDDIQIVGNRIETTATNSNFEVNTTGTGSIELLANTNVTGNLNVSGSIDVVGDITLGGNIRIGDTTLDSVTVVADFTSDLIPNASNEYDLGTSAKQWRVLNAAEFNNGVIRIDDNTIKTTVSNANLELDTNGTGSIELQSNTNITGNITVSGGTTSTINGITITGTTIDSNDSSGITFTPITTFNSDVNVENNLYVRNKTTTNDLLVEGNLTILGTETVINSTSFSITDGLIYLGEDNQSNAIDLGFVASYNDGTYQHTGLVRDATDGKWKLFSGVIDEPSLIINFNQASYATLKLGSLESNNILDSSLTTGRVVLAGIDGKLEDSSNLTFNGSNLAVNGSTTISGTLTVTGDIIGGPLRTDDIQIVGNRIETTSSNSNFEINTTGTGTIELLANSKVTGTFEATGLSTLAQAQVSDLISGRVIYTSTSGRLVDSPSLTFNGSTLTVTGILGVTGLSTLAMVQVSDLTDGRITYAGASGRLVDSGNLTFNGTTLTVTGDETVTGTATLGNLVVNGSTTLTGPITASDNLTVGGTLYVTGDIVGGPLRTDDIQIVGNRIETTSSNSNFEINTVGNGSIELLANSNVTGTFSVSELSTLAQAQVTDLTSGRLTYAGASGRLIDSANLTFSGTALTVTGNETVTGTATLGSLLVNGFTTLTGPAIASDTLTVAGTLYVTGDIVGGPLRTDDIQIVGNRIETTATNSNFEVNTTGTGSIELLADTNVTGDLNVSGSVDVTGNITLGGNIRIGDTTLDNVTVVADFTSDLIPNASNEYDLGTANKAWRNVYAGQIDVDGIRIDTTTISTVNSNANLELTPSGTGIVYINGTGAIRIPTGNTFQRPATGEAGFIRFNNQTNNIEAWNGVTFAGISGGSSSDTNGDTLISYETGGNNEDIIRFFTGVAGLTAGSSIGSVEQVQISSTGLNVIRNLTVGNDFTVTGNATISEITTDDVRISGNRISTTQSNSNLELTSNGAGVVSVQDTLSVAEDLSVAGTSTLARANVSDLTDGRITYAGASGRLKDSANLAFNGTTLALTGNQTISGTLTVGGVDVSGAASFDNVEITELLVNGRIHIYDNIIENTLTNDDLIIRANGTGRVIIDGAGTSEGSGNIYATDPLLTLNSAKTTSNTYDSGIIIERGTDINVGLIWDESEDQFAFIRTIEQGTVKGNVAITGYQDLTVGTVKLNSETASKVTFTDASKYVRSLDTGTTAYVDGVIKFNTGAQAAIPTGSTAQRPASPQEGTIRYNTTVQQFEGYADSSWQAMGFGAGTAPSYQGFLADGTEFEFTLNQVPLSSAGIIVAINGVVQEPEIAYTVDNAILRFIDDTSTVVAPDVGDRIDVRFLSKPAVSTVRTSNFTGDDTTRAFDTGYTIGSVETVLVFVNSIYQDTDVYTVSGRSVVFDEAPYQDDRVNIVNITTIVAPDLPTKTYVDQQITQVSNTATDDAIAFAIALG